MTNLPSTASAPLLQIEKGIATITLNRPAQRNRLENENFVVTLSSSERRSDGSSGGAHRQHARPA